MLQYNNLFSSTIYVCTKAQNSVKKVNYFWKTNHPKKKSNFLRSEKNHVSRAASWNIHLTTLRRFFLCNHPAVAKIYPNIHLRIEKLRARWINYCNQNSNQISSELWSKIGSAVLHRYPSVHINLVHPYLVRTLCQLDGMDPNNWYPDKPWI